MRKICISFLILACAKSSFAADFDFPKAAKMCAVKSPSRAPDPRLALAVEIAREQHKLFGSQIIDRNGGLVSIGYHEAEFDHGSSDPTPTWKRVASFWAALGDNKPPTFRAPGQKLNRKNLYEKIEGLSFATLPSSEEVDKLDAVELEGINSALLRSSLVDHPWSAAFISFVMKSAGFQKSEFEFSEAHADYVDRAFMSTEAELSGAKDGYAYRACDIRTTVPRAGDLLCSVRQEAAALNTFQALEPTLVLRRSQPKPGAVPMHCDLVVLADEKGNSKLGAIGGNVFQSVTLRKMSLNASKRISTTYIASENPNACASAEKCPGHLNYRPWAVLLEFRDR